MTSSSNVQTTSSTLVLHNKESDISVKEIIEKYYTQNPELLKHALMAKIEEDRKQAANDRLKTEQARIQLRQLDLKLIQEQSNQQRKSPIMAHPVQWTPKRMLYHKPIPVYPSRSFHPYPLKRNKQEHDTLKAKIHPMDTQKPILPMLAPCYYPSKPILPPIDTSLSRMIVSPHPLTKKIN